MLNQAAQCQGPLFLPLPFCHPSLNHQSLHPKPCIQALKFCVPKPACLVCRRTYSHWREELGEYGKLTGPAVAAFKRIRAWSAAHLPAVAQSLKYEAP